LAEIIVYWKKIVRFSIETWFVMGIYFFYLFDSVKLLHHNQLVFLRENGRWKVICPNSRWQILRKLPYFFNPLAPNNPVFLGTWSLTGGVGCIDEVPEIDRFIGTIHPLNYFVIVLFVLMCFFMPLAILSYGTGVTFLAITIAAYLCIVAMLVVLYKKCSGLRLSSKEFYSLAFDCIACPPFAINLVRKITWQYKIGFDPIEFAISKLAKEDASKLARSLVVRLDEKLLSEDDTATRSEKLRALKIKLSELF
jgi:hypothetical protein